MPVYVRWQWKEKTRTFLVIFYFYDDLIKSNLRFRPSTVTKSGKLLVLEDAENNPDVKPQPVMTWAPTHVEIALLGDVLRYANIIDGLSEVEKRILRNKLEIESSEKDRYVIDATAYWEDFFKGVPAGLHMIAFAGRDDWYLGCELDEKYIKYLAKTLEPYLKP
jgi:hypothetical protein